MLLRQNFHEHCRVRSCRGYGLWTPFYFYLKRDMKHSWYQNCSYYELIKKVAHVLTSYNNFN